MRLEEFFTGNLQAGPGSIDGGLPVPVTPAYGEEKYARTDAAKKSVYNDVQDDEDNIDQEEEFATVKPRLRAILKVLQAEPDGDPSDELPNASDYALGLDDEALKAQL